MSRWDGDSRAQHRRGIVVKLRAAWRVGGGALRWGRGAAHKIWRTKATGSRLRSDGVSCAVEAGEVVGLVGHRPTLPQHTICRRHRRWLDCGCRDVRQRRGSGPVPVLQSGASRRCCRRRSFFAAAACAGRAAWVLVWELRDTHIAEHIAHCPAARCQHRAMQPPHGGGWGARGPINSL